jgi:hypothetical protein
MTTEEKLAAIKPASTYPSFVTITTKDGTKVEFWFNSFVSGLYVATRVNGQTFGQAGYRSNASAVRKIKTVIRRALKRGETVEIGDIRNLS